MGDGLAKRGLWVWSELWTALRSLSGEPVTRGVRSAVDK
jgi:hypothetical protein